MPKSGSRPTIAPDLSSALSLVRQLQPALARGNRAAQVDILGQLVAMRAEMGGQWQQLATIAAHNGEHRLARRAIALFVEASGNTAEAQYQKATLLFELNDLAEADALLRSLPETVPDPVGNAYSRGIAALNLGKSDEARRYLEHVTQQRPDAGSAWLALSMTVNLAAETALADRIFAAERAFADAIPAARAPYYYALGKAHAERGEPALAFAAFARGAADMKTLARYDRRSDAAQAEEAVRGFSAATIADIGASQQQPTSRTIFVTGLPRSGTTLVEQILTSHSAVSDGAETNLLLLLARDVGGTSHRALARYTEAQGVAPAADLWAHLMQERFPAPGHIVDKTINASRYLGLAASLLPEAPLIWVTRDPLDRAWSCFRTNFMGGAMPWSYDLRDIAAHFRLEDQLLAQWQGLLGERLLVLSYEALVTQPGEWIGRILAHCGLPPEPQVFAPHENQRPVVTASMMQVRRPINRDAVGSAEPYRAFLEPFREAFA